MSTDQYPEVNTDDTALVPQQPPGQEWPKKIRTLTAAELDRLTIDGDGRFYWDGHLVNYQPPQNLAPNGQKPEPVDLDALALLDRAAFELSGPPPERASAETTETTETAPPVVAGHPHEAPRSSDATVPPAVPIAAVTPAGTVTNVPQLAPSPMFDMPRRNFNDKVRFRMSFWQTVGLWVVIVGLLVGAIGLAISGMVAAHDWGCRAQLVKQYCPPPPPAPKPPARADIPA